MTCDKCKRDAERATFGPGTGWRWLCDGCRRPAEDRSGVTCFVRGGADPVPGRDVPRTVRGYYDGGERSGVKFV